MRRAPDLGALRRDLAPVLAAGISSLAVVLKHSAIFPDHELQVGALAASMGFTQVSLSSQVAPVVRMVPRGFTAAADAYLTPHILRYVRAFQAGFDPGLARVPLYFMQSDGGLAGAAAFSGHKAILSGPAGGYVGYAVTTRWEAQPPAQVIGFDMVRWERACMGGCMTACMAAMNEFPVLCAAAGGRCLRRGGLHGRTGSERLPPARPLPRPPPPPPPLPCSSRRAAPPPTCPGTRGSTSTCSSPPPPGSPSRRPSWTSTPSPRAAAAASSSRTASSGWVHHPAPPLHLNQIDSMCARSSTTAPPL